MTAVLVRLRVDDGAYALPVSQVHEVMLYGEVWPVPGARPASLGVRNLRGEVLPVFDLAAALSRRPARARERLLVVEHDGRRAAFAVDEVMDVGPESDHDDSTPIDLARVLVTLAEEGQ